MTKTGKLGKRSTGAIMSLPECANYLHLGEKTVLRLAANAELPGELVGGKWQFQRGAVDEWVQEQLDLAEDESLEEIPDGTRVPLGDVLPSEGVLGDLKATDALGVIEELAAHAYNHKWLNDKPWFVGAVVEREALSSTAMEGGVAFLHTRAREADRLARPFVIVGRSYQGIDFGAPDGKPTFLFFLLGLKYDRLHLPILGRLARTMLNPATIAKLRAQPSASKMRALLLAEDARALAGNKQVPVRYEVLQPKLDKQMRLRTIMRLNAMRKHEARKAAEAERKAAAKEARKATPASTKKKATRRAGASESAAGEKKAAADKPAKKQTAKKRTSAADKQASGGKKKSPAGNTAAAKVKSSKKTTAKKTATKKSPTAKKTATKKSPTTKKTTAKKGPAAQKTTAKKAATKKTTAKKTTAKKTTAKKVAARKTSKDAGR